MLHCLHRLLWSSCLTNIIFDYNPSFMCLLYYSRSCQCNILYAWLSLSHNTHADGLLSLWCFAPKLAMSGDLQSDNYGWGIGMETWSWWLLLSALVAPSILWTTSGQASDNNVVTATILTFLWKNSFICMPWLFCHIYINIIADPHPDNGQY